MSPTAAASVVFAPVLHHVNRGDDAAFVRGAGLLRDPDRGEVCHRSHIPGARLLHNVLEAVHL